MVEHSPSGLGRHLDGLDRLITEVPLEVGKRPLGTTSMAFECTVVPVDIAVGVALVLGVAAEGAADEEFFLALAGRLGAEAFAGEIRLGSQMPSSSSPAIMRYSSVPATIVSISLSCRCRLRTRLI